MDETNDTNPRGETKEDDQESTNGDTSDTTDPNHSTVTTALAGTSSGEGHSQQPADDSVEGRSSLASPSSQDDDVPTANDDTAKQPSLAEVNTEKQPSLAEADTDKQSSPVEVDTEEQTSLKAEAEADDPSSSYRVDRQLRLLQQESVAETDLDQEAAHHLRQDSQQDSKARHDVVVEMDTFQRSSVRRDSFIMAIEGTEGGEPDNTAVSPETDTKTTTNLEESNPDLEELEIFVDEESDWWQAIRRQCQGGRKWVICGTVLLLLGVLAAIILIPQSLVYVEYYQMALARSRLTGRVDRSRTLYSGCYLLFPDTNLVLFKSTAHHVHSQIEVTSADGLALGLQLSLQYFIKGEELGELHATYGEQYEEVVRAVIENEVKNSVVNLTLDQYRLHRPTVERLLHSRLAVKLKGDCCPSHCVNSSKRSADNCSSTCNPNPDCAQNLHVSLLPQHVQLGAVNIPAEVNERYLRFTLLQVEAEKEALLQESTVESKMTELLTKDIKNQAHEVLEAARWDGRRVRLEAEANAELTRQRAYSQALKQLLTDLNITAMDQRLSLLLLLAYREVEEPLIFQQMEGLSLFGGMSNA